MPDLSYGTKIAMHTITISIHISNIGEFFTNTNFHLAIFSFWSAMKRMRNSGIDKLRYSVLHRNTLKMSQYTTPVFAKIRSN